MAKKTTTKKKPDKLDAILKSIATQGQVLKQHGKKLDTIISITTHNSEQVVSINAELRGVYADIRGISNRLDTTDHNVTANRSDSLVANKRITKIEGYLDSQSTGWRGRTSA
jgi:hypothetical protein